MASESQGLRGRTLPIDQPLEALRADHRFVKQLLERFQNSDSMNVKKEAAREALILIETHSALEESVFYPAVQQTDASLINHCKEAHQEVDQLVVQLKSLLVDDPRFEQLFQQLATSLTRHIDEEEQQLFPKIEQANIDMKALGSQMQLFEANIVDTQARQSS
jgi:hemerythrin superfamily protein